jgi:excisionase family DNA binding protein
MSGELSLDQAAEQLGITRPTVVAYLDAGHLDGGKVRRGTTQWSRKVDQASVDAYLAANGRGPLRTRSTKVSRLRKLEEQMAAVLDAIGPSAGGSGSATSAEVTRMRAHIVTLEESVARSHAAADLQRQADEARSEEIEHLRDALGAAERAHALSRLAYAEIEEAVAGFTRAGYVP